MSRRGWTGYLRSGTALGLLVIATAQASAGGFGIREQSAYGQGTSFAGIAAGGALSSMFWNPATMTQVPGIQSESDVAGILGYAAHTPELGSALPFGGTSNTAEAAFVPASYLSYQFSPNLWLGMAINAPFGLSMNFPDRWAGRDFGAGPTNLHTYNATPSIAYRINDWISVGAGVQIQYATEVVTLGLGPTPGLQAVIKGNGWGYGFTAGATLTPTPTTTIGIGWRSFIDQKIDSTLSTSCRATRDDNRIGQHDSQSPRHRVTWHSPAPRSALDSHGNGGMVELEPHRHFGVDDAKRGCHDQSLSRWHFRSSIKTDGSSRAAPNTSGPTG